MRRRGVFVAHPALTVRLTIGVARRLSLCNQLSEPLLHRGTGGRAPLRVLCPRQEGGRKAATLVCTLGVASSFDALRCKLFRRNTLRLAIHALGARQARRTSIAMLLCLAVMRIEHLWQVPLPDSVSTEALARHDDAQRCRRPADACPGDAGVFCLRSDL